MGRPSYKVTARVKQRVYKLARKGLNEEEIAKGLRIAYSTFKVHKRLFSAAINKGRAEGDLLNMPLVENALLKRCLGIEWEEVQTKQDGQVVNGKLTNGKISKTITKKFIPPDPASIFFYTSNRNRLRWINSMKIEPPEPGEGSKRIPIVSHIPEIEKAVDEPSNN